MNFIFDYSWRENMLEQILSFKSWYPTDKGGKTYTVEPSGSNNDVLLSP